LITAKLTTLIIIIQMVINHLSNLNQIKTLNQPINRIHKRNWEVFSLLLTDLPVKFFKIIKIQVPDHIRWTQQILPRKQVLICRILIY